MLPTQRDEDAVQGREGPGQRVPGPTTGRVSWTETMEGFRRILPVTLYVVPIGLALGAAALQQDLPGPLAILMSAVNFAGLLAVRGPGSLVGEPGPGPSPAHHLCRQRPPRAARRLPSTLAQQAAAIAPLCSAILTGRL